MTRKNSLVAILTVILVMTMVVSASAAELSNDTSLTQDVSGKTTVFTIKNNPGQTSVTQSGSFEAYSNQMLTIDIKSTILGGTVDLFLFSPNGVQQRIVISNRNETKSITLTKGIWAYNCTGFFDCGNVSIIGGIGVGTTLGQAEGQPANNNETLEFQTTVFTIKNNPNQTSVTQSGSFISGSDQLLILDIDSNVSGGTVDLFLMGADGGEQRISIGNTVETKEINITKGEWAYNCTGFFTKGEISITATVKDGEEALPHNTLNSVFSISNNPGQTSVTQSGSFYAKEGQKLTIKVTTISGGTVDLFLFSPNNW